MFKMKKAVAVVMATMLGVSGIVSSMIRNNVGAMPFIGIGYVLPADYEISEEEQYWLDQLRNDEIININDRVYNLGDEKEEFSGDCTLLMIAAYKDWLKLAKELLESSADITLVDNGGRNAVMLAAEKHNIEMLYLLYYSRCYYVGLHINDVNDWPKTALMEALSTGADLDLVSLLVGWGADVNIDIVTNGADGGERHYTPLGAAIGGECGEDVIKFLLAKGADPNIGYGDAQFPLEGAFFHHYGCTLMQSLLEHGVDTSAHDYSDLLGRAMLENKTDIANLLRSYDVNNPSPERLKVLRQEYN